jgi:hypothetical protein
VNDFPGRREFHTTPIYNTTFRPENQTQLAVLRRFQGVLEVAKMMRRSRADVWFA